MRLGCLLPLISIAAIAGGGQTVYTYLSNRKPTTISIETAVKGEPKAKWLRIEGGELDVTHSSSSRTFGIGDATTLFVPLVPPGTKSKEGEIHVLIATKDAELLKFVNEMHDLDQSLSSNERLKEFALRNADKLHVAKSVEGLVKFGIESNSKQLRKLKGIYPNLASDAIIVEEGKRPDLGYGIIALIGGLVLGATLIRHSVQKSKAMPPVQAPPPLPPVNSPPPPVRRF
jgi:hypothetical protein